MRKIIAAIVAAFLAVSASAQTMYTEKGEDNVTLFSQPCEVQAVTARITALGSEPSEFQAAKVHYAGADYAACWRVAGAYAHLVYEDGDQGLIPLVDFSRGA